MIDLDVSERDEGSQNGRKGGGDVLNACFPLSKKFISRCFCLHSGTKWRQTDLGDSLKGLGVR
jgi:hypothetical protein